MLEAMRLSLVEHEEQQRKQAEEEKKQRNSVTAAADGNGAGSSAADVSGASAGTYGSSPSKRRSGRVSLLQSSGTMEQDLAEMLGGNVVGGGSGNGSSRGVATTVAAELVSDAGRVVDPSVAAADVTLDRAAPVTSKTAAAEGRASAFAADSSVASEATLKNQAHVPTTTASAPPPEPIAVPMPVSTHNANSSSATDSTTPTAHHSEAPHPSAAIAAGPGSPTFGKTPSAPTSTEDAPATIRHATE